MELRVALIGCGNVGRAFLRLWQDKRRELRQRYDVSLKLTGIATAHHGIAVSSKGIDTRTVLRRLDSDRSLASLHVEGPSLESTDVFVRRCPTDVFFEITPLNPESGAPAVAYIRTALKRGTHVITANKGPVALAHRELQKLAQTRGCAFRFEGTVMDGAPVLNLVERTLPASRVLSFTGILNSTTNLVLTEMERGSSFANALARARRLGVAEWDASQDIEGWDAAAKTAVLANVLMDARLTPASVPRRGIQSIRKENVQEARRHSRVIRLVARAKRDGRRVVARVRPERLALAHPLAQVTGTTNALVLETDTMKELMILERDPGVEQTAYALLSDLVTIVRDFGPK